MSAALMINIVGSASEPSRLVCTYKTTSQHWYQSSKTSPGSCTDEVTCEEKPEIKHLFIRLKQYISMSVMSHPDVLRFDL